MKPRVFVSSVVDGFEVFRRAAREGIVAAGGEPVLVNEDFPSLVSSSRNACLDAVASSDLLVSIIGHRGGWTTPSGKLVVEEEYDHAVARKRPVLVFMQNANRDAAAERFARRVSDYVDGAFRRTFGTPDELREEIERALRPLLERPDANRGMTKPRRDHFSDPYRIPGATTLRFVFAPERDEEVIDPVSLSSDGFRRRLFESGHGAGVGIFSYECPKKAAIEDDDLVIIQTDANGRHGEGEHVRVQLAESGELVIDANVTGKVRRGAGSMGLEGLVVATEDIEGVLRLCFAFAAAVYDEIDRFKRQHPPRRSFIVTGSRADSDLVRDQRVYRTSRIPRDVLGSRERKMELATHLVLRFKAAGELTQRLPS